MLRPATITAGFNSTAVTFARANCRWQNLVSAAAPSPSCATWKSAAAGDRNSSQAIICCAYSSSMASGLRRRIAPCTHSVPKCR